MVKKQEELTAAAKTKIKAKARKDEM